MTVHPPDSVLFAEDCSPSPSFLPLAPLPLPRRTAELAAAAQLVGRQQEAALRRYWQRYTDNPRERAEPTASPLRATLTELAGLLPALVITAEADVPRDEGEQYARQLRRAAVEVTAAPFPRYGPRLRLADRTAGSPPTRQLCGRALASLRRLLG